MPTRIYYVKALRLVTPGAARQLGLAATDAPVFVSPFHLRPQRCEDCGVTYTPLLYAPGLITTAHHFHRTSGDIYCGMVNSRCQAAQFGRSWGFVAFVELPGQVRLLESVFRRAEAVRISSIAAYDYPMLRRTPYFLPEWRGSEPAQGDFSLTEGILAERPLYMDLKAGTLLPMPACLLWSLCRAAGSSLTATPVGLTLDVGAAVCVHGQPILRRRWW
jgi:hypothetical protein